MHFKPKIFLYVKFAENKLFPEILAELEKSAVHKVLTSKGSQSSLLSLRKAPLFSVHMLTFQIPGLLGHLMYSEYEAVMTFIYFETN